MAQKNINRFLEELEVEKSYSPHTLSAYKRDLRFYENFLKTKSPFLQIYEYIDKKGLSPRSKARIISSLRSFFKFLEHKGCKTPLQKLNSVQIKSKKLPKLISPADFKKILKAGEDECPHKTHRNKTSLLLLFGLGCRISEITSLNLQNINALDRSITITGKRRKQRLLPLTDSLYKEIYQYIQDHRPHLNPGNSPALLINNKGKRPSRVDIWRWLKTWSAKAGFSETKSPHQFRHGFATSLMENGADLRSIQFLLGHSSIQTTQIYTSVKKDHLQKTIALHHPLSGFSAKKT